jgi:hypothetical protein
MWFELFVNIGLTYYMTLLESVLRPVSTLNGYFVHHGMARPEFADGGDGLQIWSAAVNILSRPSRR